MINKLNTGLFILFLLCLVSPVQADESCGCGFQLDSEGGCEQYIPTDEMLEECDIDLTSSGDLVGVESIKQIADMFPIAVVGILVIIITFVGVVGGSHILSSTDSPTEDNDEFTNYGDEWVQERLIEAERQAQRLAYSQLDNKEEEPKKKTKKNINYEDKSKYDI